MATATATEPRAQQFVFYDIGWEGYQAILRLLGDRPVRSTYDRGSLEIMAPLLAHERFGYLIGRMVDTITEVLDIPVVAAGGTTFNREEADRGLEPDACYYLGNAGRLSDPLNIDLDRDPPPDLAIEIEVSRTVLNRLGVYGALGVPEIWRFNGQRLIVLLRRPDGTYAESPTSAAFPFLPMAEIARFAREYDPTNDTRWARSFRRWVTDVLVPIYQQWIADRGDRA